MKSSTAFGLRILIVLAAVALTVVPIPSEWVERFYSTGLYPHLAAAVKPLTRCMPIAVLDVLLVILVAGIPVAWIWRIRRAPAGSKGLAWLRAAFGTVTLVALLVCAFQLLWGLNYQRLPLTEKLDWDAKRITPAAITALAKATLVGLNNEVAAVHARPLPPLEEWRASLEHSFQEVVQELGYPGEFSGVMPRTSLVNPLLAAEGCDGFLNPFGYEVIMNSHVLPQEMPCLLAHEWAHLAGFADESEANFIAVLARRAWRVGGGAHQHPSRPADHRARAA